MPLQPQSKRVQPLLQGQATGLVVVEAGHDRVAPLDQLNRLQLLGADLVCDASARAYLLELNPSPYLGQVLKAGSRLREVVGRRLACSLPEVVARSLCGGGCEGCPCATRCCE